MRMTSACGWLMHCAAEESAYQYHAAIHGVVPAFWGRLAVLRPWLMQPHGVLTLAGGYYTSKLSI